MNYLEKCPGNPDGKTVQTFEANTENVRIDFDVQKRSNNVDLENVFVDLEHVAK